MGLNQDEQFTKRAIANIMHELSESTPSDLVCLTRETDIEIMNFWSGENMDTTAMVPADLILGKTIPITDLMVEIDEKTAVFESNEQMKEIIGKDTFNGTKVKARIKLFDDWDKRVDYLMSLSGIDLRAIVGCVVYDIDIKYLGLKDFGTFICPLSVSRSVDYIVLEHPYSLKYKTPMPIEAAIIVKGYLYTWYGVQICLLHPTIKDVFNHPTDSRIAICNYSNSKPKKRVTHYVKKHVLTLGEIDHLLGNNEKRQRNTLAWYVIGHWRHYKSGKNVFINGYWKGPLRTAKRNFDEGRTRIIEPKEAI